MNTTILRIIVVLLSVLAICLFNLGMDYINFDRGLHPAIAFPISTLITVIIYIITNPKPSWTSPHE